MLLFLNFFHQRHAVLETCLVRSPYSAIVNLIHHFSYSCFKKLDIQIEENEKRNDFMPTVLN